MDSAGVIPEINSTLPPVPHFPFTAIASPGGVTANANGGVMTSGHPSARKQLKPLQIENSGSLKRNNLCNSIGANKLQQQLMSQPTSDFGGNSDQH